MAVSYINGFIQNLSFEEIKAVKDHIHKTGIETATTNKIENLLAILIDNPNKKYTDGELSKLLESKQGTIRVLKSRLYSKAQEALISDSHFENSSEFNEREKVLFALRKKNLLIKSLLRKMNQGKVEALHSLLNEVTKAATKYQCYDVLIDALILQKYLKGIRTGRQEFEKIHDKISFYSDCLKCTREASDTYYRLILNYEFTLTTPPHEINKFLKNSIKKMQMDFKRTKSDEINYFKCFFQMALYENEKKFNKAIVICKKILSLVKNSIVLYNKDRIGFALGNLTHFHIFLKNYKEAIITAKNAQRYHIPNSYNYLTLKEQELLAYFYSGNYTTAYKGLKALLDHSLSDTGIFRRSKFQFYEACILFAVKKYKDAMMLLNKAFEIEKDKFGWNIAIRILIVLNFIALHKLKEASNAIASLRKHIDRNNKSKKIRDRDILIFKLLRELEKDGFKRNPGNKTAIQLLRELSDKDKPTAWSHFTPEMIPFHEWVMTLPVKN